MFNAFALLCVCLALKGGYAAILSKNVDFSNDIENGGSHGKANIIVNIFFNFQRLP